MGTWVCGITGCGGRYEQPTALIRHQFENHPDAECQICGEAVPAGYLGIRHAFESHTRAEYVRTYDADSDDIREREELIDLIEEHVDVQQLLSQLDGAGEERAVSADD